MKKYSCDSGIHAAMARVAERVNSACLGLVSEAWGKRPEKAVAIYM